MAAAAARAHGGGMARRGSEVCMRKSSATPFDEWPEGSEAAVPYCRGTRRYPAPRLNHPPTPRCGTGLTRAAAIAVHCCNGYSSTSNRKQYEHNWVPVRQGGSAGVYILGHSNQHPGELCMRWTADTGRKGEPNYIFIHVGKTGGESVQQMLASLAAGRGSALH